MIVLSADRLFTPLEEIAEPLVFIENGLIVDVCSRDEREISDRARVVDMRKQFGETILAPAFVDIHMHGGAGLDVMRATAGELPHLHKFLVKHGVSGYFPTTVAAPMDETCRALERLADVIEAAETCADGPDSRDGEAAEAVPLAIHLEGPFLSHQRRGVHPPEYLQNPTIAIFNRLWDAARGLVRMMTIAPELPGALEVIAEAAQRNVCVSIGHSDATLEAAQAGVRAGARHATHTFNAMRPLDHREPGILGEVLTDKQVSADIIADTIHTAPEIIKLFLQAKGLERSVLITDATAAAGMPDGTYQLGPIQVQVKDGKCTKDGKLAGSVLTMDRAVRNVNRVGGWSLQHAIRAASLNAAQAVSLEKHGRLTPGAEANLVVLSRDGEVRKTIVRGRGI